MKEMNKLAYQVTQVPSKRSDWDISDERFYERIAEQLPQAQVLVWQYHRLQPMKIEGGEWLTDERPEPSQIVRMRIFNELSEIHIWREGDSLKGRFRTDTEGEPCNVVDTGQYLLPAVRKLWPEDSFEKIVTRNYIGYSDAGLAGYTDARFLSLKESP